MRVASSSKAETSYDAGNIEVGAEVNLANRFYGLQLAPLVGHLGPFRHIPHLEHRVPVHRQQVVAKALKMSDGRHVAL